MSDTDRPGSSPSRSLLELLHMIGDPALIGYLKELYADFPVAESEEHRLASERGRELTNSFMKQLVAIRVQPAFRGLLWQHKGLELPLEAFRSADVDAELLDEHFMFELLSAVPGMVSRRELLIERPSIEHRVRAYTRQATTCYLHGFSDAAAVLCRAALEAALSDAVGSRGGVAPVNANLKNLIRFAQTISPPILTPEMAGRADRIRMVGRDAIHNVTCSEPEALVQIRETAQVLQHIYGGTGPKETR